METQQLKHVLDILMAAAAADGHTDFQERDAIRSYLEELGVDEEEAMDDLESHQWLFDPGKFDLEESVKGLGELSADERSAVIRMLEKVEAADGVIDLAESEFISRVAVALGASDEEADKLTLEIMDAKAPPPIPEDD